MSVEPCRVIILNALGVVRSAHLLFEVYPGISFDYCPIFVSPSLSENNHLVTTPQSQVQRTRDSETIGALSFTTITVESGGLAIRCMKLSAKITCMCLLLVRTWTR